MSTPRFQSKANIGESAGFTLVEVLVAVVVLAIGLLGLASLRVASLHFNHSAYLRSQATLMAYDMAERMKANPVALRNGTYNIPAKEQNGDCLTITGCNPVAMAQNDAYEWDTALRGILPDGRGVVCLDGSPNDATYGDDGEGLVASCDGAGAIYVVKLGWKDDRAKGGTEDGKEVFETSFLP